MQRTVVAVLRGNEDLEGSTSGEGRGVFEDGWKRKGKEGAY